MTGTCESCGREADLIEVLADGVPFCVCRRCAAIGHRPLRLPFPDRDDD